MEDVKYELEGGDSAASYTAYSEDTDGPDRTLKKRGSASKLAAKFSLSSKPPSPRSAVSGRVIYVSALPGPLGIMLCRYPACGLD